MRTLNSLFNDSVEKYKDNVCLLENQGNGYEPTTYQEARHEVHRFAAGLLSLGIKKGRPSGPACRKEGINGSTVKWASCIPGL